jgi:hypothetical protein
MAAPPQPANAHRPGPALSAPHGSRHGYAGVGRKVLGALSWTRSAPAKHSLRHFTAVQSRRSGTRKPLPSGGGSVDMERLSPLPDPLPAGEGGCSAAGPIDPAVSRNLKPPAFAGGVFTRRSDNDWMTAIEPVLIPVCSIQRCRSCRLSGDIRPPVFCGQGSQAVHDKQSRSLMKKQ